MATWRLMTAAALATLVAAVPVSAQQSGSPSTGTDRSTTEQPRAGGDTMKSKDTMKSSDTTMKSSDTAKADKKSGAMHHRKTGAAGMGDEKVKAAQQALKDKGHDPGSVDGKLGPKTQAALRDFQKAQGIDTTGRLDAKTMQSLGVDRTSSSAAPSATGGSASPATGASDASKDASKDAASAPAKTPTDSAGAGSPATGGASTDKKTEEKK
jgi:peptidoglycan hydrolase-like protein with peptidoglycan-binding domain